MNIFFKVYFAVINQSFYKISGNSIKMPEHIGKLKKNYSNCIKIRCILHYNTREMHKILRFSTLPVIYTYMCNLV